MATAAWGLMAVALAGCCQFGERRNETVYLTEEEIDFYDFREIVSNVDEGDLPSDLCTEICDDHLHVTSQGCFYEDPGDGGADVTCYYDHYC
ncbi:MAG: hypothetical protein H6739_14975 [Alphaproteobacteria bacterium]|nr:hypothetical protein [Alphaproteobacteria bacterium]